MSLINADKCVVYAKAFHKYLYFIMVGKTRNELKRKKGGQLDL